MIGHVEKRGKCLSVEIEKEPRANHAPRAAEVAPFVKTLAANGTAVPSPFVLGRRPELDGLRAVAVLIVILSHVGLIGRVGGFGVELFFVLSGFLIATLLFEEHDEGGGVRLSHFYARRAIRLAPAMILTLGAVLALAMVSSPAVRTKTLQEVGWTAAQLSDVARAWDLHPMNILGHTWSLSVEEQFYAVIPVLLVVVLGRAPAASARVVWLFGGLIAAVVAWRTVLSLSGASAERIYNGPDTRCDQLLAGCLLAALAWRGNATFSASNLNRWRIAAAVSLVGVVAGYTLMQTGSVASNVLRYPINTIAGVCVIGYLLCRPQSVDGSLLRRPTMVSIGRISYGLYLFHVPIMQFISKRGYPLPIHAGLTIAAAFAVALASWYLVERPVSGLRHRFQGNRRADLASTACGR